MYKNKLQEEGVQHVVNINKMKSDTYGALEDQAYICRESIPRVFLLGPAGILAFNIGATIIYSGIRIN